MVENLSSWIRYKCWLSAHWLWDLRQDTVLGRSSANTSKGLIQPAYRAVLRERLSGHEQALQNGTGRQKALIEERHFLNTRLDTIF